jgi:hypothetical protein
MTNTLIRVTASEAEAVHGISRARIRKLRQRGRIRPCGKDGRAHLYDLRQLRAIPRDARPRDEHGRFAAVDPAVAH